MALKNPAAPAVTREADELVRHDNIVLVRPLIFLLRSEMVA